MKNLLLGFLLILTAAGCAKKSSPRSAALPDNILSDKPIVLKEGQAIVLMKAGDPKLKIAASVVDGKLAIAEVDFNGHNFGVTWTDSETWETSTMVSDGENHSYVMVKDENMDGFADFKAEATPVGTHRFELKGQEWVELKRRQKQSEQDIAPNDR